MINVRKIKLLDQVNLIRDKKKQVYTFSMLTFIVIIVLAVGAIKPSLETIVRIRSEIKQKQDVLERLETKMDALNALQIQFTEFENTAKDLVLIFPANGDFSLFLANIEYLAIDAGFSLNSISFSDINSRSDSNLNILKPVEVRLSVKGDRRNLIEFMKRLEGTPMFAEIESLSFSVDEENLEQTEVPYSIQISIFGIDNENFYD